MLGMVSALFASRRTRSTFYGILSIVLLFTLFSSSSHREKIVKTIYTTGNNVQKASINNRTLGVRHLIIFLKRIPPNQL